MDRESLFKAAEVCAILSGTFAVIAALFYNMAWGLVTFTQNQITFEATKGINSTIDINKVVTSFVSTIDVLKYMIYLSMAIALVALLFVFLGSRKKRDARS